MKKYVLIFFGLPGVGKSTLINHFRDVFNFYYVSIDDIWKKCFNHPSYTIDQSAVVFDKLIDVIENMMKNEKKSIIIEEVFASKERVKKIKLLASRFEYVCVAILVGCTRLYFKKKNTRKK